jgi:hypothetical protein
LGFVPLGVLYEPQRVGCAGVRSHRLYPPNQNAGVAKDWTEGLEMGLGSGFQRRSALVNAETESVQLVPEVETSTWPLGNSARRDREAVGFRPPGAPPAGSMWLAPAPMITRWLATLRGRSARRVPEVGASALRPESWVRQVPGVEEAPQPQAVRAKLGSALAVGILAGVEPEVRVTALASRWRLDRPDESGWPNAFRSSRQSSQPDASPPHC